MRRVMKLAAVALAGSLVLAGCGGNETSTSGGSAAGGKKLKVGMAYDIGGRGDLSFNDAAAAGLDRAKSELGVETKELEASPGETDAQKEERLRLLAQGGFNPVVAVGFVYATALKKVAPEFPDTKFGIIDDASFQADNVANLTFAENEGSFLVGAAAALKSKTGTVGFVGGVNTPLIQKFEAGFEAGAKAANPQIKIKSAYLTQPPDFTGFTDPAKGRTAGQGEYDAGADVVFAAAGASGLGVFQAAKAGGKMAIGVDSDQAKSAPAAVRGVIITSMLKKVDVAVFDFIKTVQDDKFQKGQKVYDLKAGGVDFSTTGGQIDDIKSKLDDYKQQIIDGKITVPTKPGA